MFIIICNYFSNNNNNFYFIVTIIKKNESKRGFWETNKGLQTYKSYCLANNKNNFMSIDFYYFF